MVLSLLKRRSAPVPVHEPEYPAGLRIYCIGDIHGRDDLLAELHGMIEQDALSFSGKKQVLYLGDYIDRGPSSNQVIERLVSQPLEGFDSIFLLGNHEQALLDFLQDARAMASWMTWGGVETLRSYGIETGPMPSPMSLDQISHQLKLKLPDSHLRFLEELQHCYQAGDYYFVHAGIRPGVPLQRQELGDQLWIRESFTQSRQDHGSVVVHGHSISREVEMLPNRIGIDTGAFHTGVLTALVLEQQSRRLLQTGEGLAS